MATQAPLQPGTSIALTPLAESPGAFRIGGLSSPHKVRYFNSLFYGAPGCGETTLTGSAVDVPEMNDILLVAAEGGELVLEDNPRIKRAHDIDVVRIERIEQLQKIFDFLQLHCRLRDKDDEVELEKLQRKVFGIPAEVKLGGEGEFRIRKYKTIILDSLTEVEAHNLEKILGLDEQGIDAGADLNVADYAAFRKNNNMIQRIVRELRDLPIHFLCICAQKYSQDELKRFHYTPALTGKLVEQVQGFFDVVGWLVVGQATDETGAGPRRLFVQPQAQPRADAKCRLASYNKAFFDNPTMESILGATGYIKRT